MFDRIRHDEVLFGALRGTCSENNVGITFAPELCDAAGEIDDEKVLIIKPDHIYSSAFIHNPPKAIDCIVIVKCDDGEHFDMYLIELRNVKRPGAARPSEISGKFQTISEDFFQERFAGVFADLLPRIRAFKAYLITDPYGVAGKDMDPEAKKALYAGTALDAYTSVQPFYFGQHAVPIEFMLPTPTIPRC